MIAITLLLASRAFSTELLVPSQYPTIQAAIDDAGEGDTIVVWPGIYTGEGNRDITFSGKTITVRSIDPNDPWIVDNTIIDCGWPGTGFNINANSVLDGLTITNAYRVAANPRSPRPAIRICIGCKKAPGASSAIRRVVPRNTNVYSPQAKFTRPFVWRVYPPPADKPVWGPTNAA